MTDSTLVPAPSQTSGPFLSIGLLREHIGYSIVFYKVPRCFSISCSLFDLMWDSISD